MDCLFSALLSAHSNIPDAMHPKGSACTLLRKSILPWVAMYNKIKHYNKGMFGGRFYHPSTTKIKPTHLTVDSIFV